MTSTNTSADPLTARVRDVVLATTVGAVVGIVGGLASVLVDAPNDAVRAVVATSGGLFGALAGGSDGQLWWLEPLVHDLGPWTAASLAVGYLFRRELSVAVWGGLVAQVALTLAYAAGYAQRHDWLTFGHALSAEDLVLALVAGPAFGAVGALLHDGRERVRTTCLALAAAPWYADGLRDVLAALDGTLQAVLTGQVAILVGQWAPRAVAQSRREWRRSVLPAMALGVVITAFLYLL